MKLSENKIIIVAIAMYILSWLLPISGLSGLKGYQGASLAHEMLTDGSAYLYESILNSNLEPIDKLLKETINICAGLPNILFIISVLLLLFKKYYTLYFTAPCVLIMLLWALPTFPPGAVHLWAISGVIIFYLSLNSYIKKNNITYLKTTVSTPFIITYLIGAFVLTVNIITK